MFHKNYVEKAKSAILNRVKFHAPVVFDDDINLRALFVRGVDARLPVFKFDKVLNKPLLHAFELALREENFNLLFSQKSVGKFGRQICKKIPNAVIFDENFGGAFLDGVNKLNINYVSASNYNLLFKDRFFKVNGQILNPHYSEFALQQCGLFGNVFVDYDEFVLNGSNFLCTLQNRCDKEVRSEIELNIPLEKGYYYFKRMPHAILIENLISKEKKYLNFVCKNARFSFSDVDGLENSVFSCVNVKAKICLGERKEETLFFNFGDAKFSPKNIAQMRRLRQISWQKNCQVFDVQVKTKNPDFDFFFNKTLPQKIWTNWLNGTVDDLLEEKYTTYRRLFLKGKLQEATSNKNETKKSGNRANIFFDDKQGGLTLVNFEKIGLRELGIFNGEYYKKIYVVKGDEKFLKVGRTFFYNICGITEHSLKSKEPISVCFGN